MTGANVENIRIVLVDDHSVVRSGLRILIEQHDGLTVVGEADTGATALQIVAHEQPTVVILDLRLNGESGLDIIPALQKVAQHTRILVLTATEDIELHRRAIRLGAVGLVQKAQAADVMIQAIEQVARGDAWLDPVLVQHVLADLSRARYAGQADTETIKVMTLTPRERDVIALVCEGLQNRMIGERLAISDITVRHHLTSVFGKLQVANRLELVIYAYRHGLAKFM